MAKCNISQGDTIHFWKDSWNETELELRFPQLYSYARDKEITVKKAYECIQDDIYDLFQLPLSVIALQQCHELQHLVNNINISDTPGHMKISWSRNQILKQDYNALIGNPPKAAAPFQWIWKSAVIHRHKFFFWLLIQDMLSTKELLWRKRINMDSYDCVLCED